MPDRLDPLVAAYMEVHLGGEDVTRGLMGHTDSSATAGKKASVWKNLHTGSIKRTRFVSYYSRALLSAFPGTGP